MSRPALSVVVPATDRPGTLPRAVAAIERARDRLDGAGPAQVIVVDDPPGLPVCEARNAGARHAEAPVVVFVDADVEIHPDALTRIAAAFTADRGLSAVFGSYDDLPPAGGTVSAFRNLLHHHVHQSAPGPAETFWSGLGAVRREAFWATGGFDADRFTVPSVEDIDLGVRLSRAGARIRLDPTIQGTHLKAWTLRSMLATDFTRRAVPWIGLQCRTGRASTTLNCGRRHRASAACAAGALAGLLARRPLAAAAAMGGMVALNRDFYTLLARRRGRAAAAVGVGLHALHHLTAVAAVPVGVATHIRDRRRGARR